jgi:hypothetical protein
MTVLLPLLLCTCILLPCFAAAEEPENDAQHEPVCARASKTWSEALLERLREEIESHGLPAGKKAK